MRTQTIKIICFFLLSLSEGIGWGQSQIPPSSSLNLIWPLKGKVVTEFNPTSKGVDIGGNFGDPVLAGADGVVVYAGNSIRDYGNLIIIKHDSTYLTAYGYNKILMAKEGQPVKQGQKIAEVGSLDESNPRLHFEVRIYGKPVDPMPYLNGTVPVATKKIAEATTMDEAKNKCIDLGFKRDTEPFGKCVLRLTK